MDKVNEIVLESAVVILSGGVDKNKTALITVPVDSADLLDIYSVGDILRLLQVFVDLCGGHVAVVADLKHGWTEECIEKLTYLLDELQITRKGCIRTAYIVKPCVKTKKRHLHRQLSRVRDKARIVTNYDVKRVESLEELYVFIEKSQLTTDYGGTMPYNHIAWVDFHRTYTPVLLDIKETIEILPAIKDDISRLSSKDIDSFRTCHEEELLKYQSLLVRYNVRECISNCQDAIERLEHPECDPNLVQTHSVMLVDTLNQLKCLHLRLSKDLSDMDAIMKRTNAEHAIFMKLEECSENTTEVEETIELMMQQAKDLPLVGTNAEEAQKYRNIFSISILVPSRDIVSCATSILQDLDCGKDTTPKSYAVAIEIAKRLTDTLQPFTQHLNGLNEIYTRIHLFFVICDKTKRWKQKATYFLTKVLCIKNKTESTERVCSITKDKTRAGNISIEAKDKGQGKQNNELHINLDSLTNKKEMPRGKIIAAPTNWETLLQTFYKKHPPPKKKHIRLLNKFIPMCIHEKQRNNAEVLAERVMFMLQMLKRTVFKADDVALIQLWSDQNNLNNLTTIESSDVTLV